MGGIKYAPQEIVEKSFLLASDAILRQAFVPNVIYKLSRGGDLPGNIASEIMKYYGIKNLLATVHAKHYGPDNHIQADDLVDILGYTLPPWEIRPNSNVLVFDDLNDTNHTYVAINDDILSHNPGLGKGNIKSAFLFYKERPESSLDDKVEYRRIYTYGEPKPETKETLHSTLNSIHKPDFYAEKIPVPDPVNPKYWIDIQTHELVGMSPNEIKNVYGRKVMESIFDANFKLLEENFGTEFTDQIMRNLVFRATGQDNLVKEVKIPPRIK